MDKEVPKEKPTVKMLDESIHNLNALMAKLLTNQIKLMDRVRELEQRFEK